MGPTQVSLDSAEVTAAVMFSGLECRIGRAALALPTESVGQIIEYAVASPAPLASDWISGMGVHAGRVLMSVSLRPRAQLGLPARRVTKAVMLNSTTGRSVGWALEVSAVSSLVSVRSVEPSRARPGITPPAWLKEALTVDGRRIGWLDVTAMMRAFDEQLGR
jgi:chemotaxis signal transduction protein